LPLEVLGNEPTGAGDVNSLVVRQDNYPPGSLASQPFVAETVKGSEPLGGYFTVDFADPLQAPREVRFCETAERLDVAPAAVAEEVVEADDLEARKRSEQRGDQRRSDEAAGAGDKQPHRSLHPRTISVKISSRPLSSRH
jgi:hypothetical protein